MKRKWIALLTAAFLAIFVLAPTEVARAAQCPYCGGASDQIGSMPSTCVDEGYTEWRCSNSSCAQEFRIPISALGHDWVRAAELDVALTCTENGAHGWRCSRCGETSYGTILAPGHDWKDADCTHPRSCQRAGCGATEGDALGHDWIAPDCTHAKTCQRVGCGETEGDALGHDYKVTRTLPTCTKGGYTTYSCARCSGCHTANKTARLGHWFGEWTANGDGTHSAECLRDGCKHTGKVSCKAFVWTVNSQDITLCPVCGENSTGQHLRLVANTKASAANNTLPRGELVLMRGTLPDSTEIMSVGFEYAGKPVQPKGIVDITVPTETFEGYTLTLVNMDRAESQIPCELSDGHLAFSLDFTPVEGAEPVPTRLIRLITVVN